MLNECPICHRKVKPGEKLRLEFVPGAEEWVMKHYRPAMATEDPLPDGSVLECGIAGCWEPVVIPALQTKRNRKS